MSQPWIFHSEHMSLALTLDLLVTVPLAYWIVISRTSIPQTTVVPVVFLCVVIGTWLMPVEHQFYLSFFKNWGLPVIELSVVTFLIIKVRSTIQSYKEQARENADFFSTLNTVCLELLPKKMVVPLVTEISIIYYGLLNWTTLALKENEFSYHKRSGTPSVIGAIIFIIIIETFALHIVVEKWSVVLAWVLTGLSIYSGIQMFGYARSLSKRPIRLESERLLIRYGVMSETEIPMDEIEYSEVTRRRVTFNNEIRKLSPLGEFESHNFIIHCSKEQELSGLFGIRKKYKSLALHIDEPERFKVALDGQLNTKMS